MNIDIQNYLRIMLVLSSILSGLFGGLTATFAKMTINVAIACDVPLVFFNPDPYGHIFSVSMSLSVLANLFNLNFTIGLYRQLMVLPPFESCVIFGNLLCGGIIMKEFRDYSWG